MGPPASAKIVARVGTRALSAFSQVEPQAARVFTRIGRSSTDRAFRAAVRHSRNVRILRIAVPAMAVLGLIGGFGLSILLSPIRALSKMPVDIGSVVVSGTKIMMQQPRLAGFTKAYCDELAMHNIQVNGLAPGYYATEITRKTRSDPVTNQRVLDHVPAGRWGEPVDLMGALVFLASRASDYVNGHLLVVDGGYLVR